VDARFELVGTSLGISRVAKPGPPVWLDLYELVGLDAIGDPVDGLTEVEIRMADGTTIGAGWTAPFCDAVVEALQRTTVEPAPAPADVPDAEPADATAAGAAPVAQPAPPTEPSSEPPDAARPVSEPAPRVALGSPEAGEPGTATGPHAGVGSDGDGAPQPPVSRSSTLELEDVVYLGGYPGQSRRRKRCTVTMDREALELRGPSDLRMRIAWADVRTVEVQNADEARFRMNTKIHRDASALVVECEQDVTVLLEARDCPTIPLRSAIAQLMADLPVVVV
jgi:hypothetical protein